MNSKIIPTPQPTQGYTLYGTHSYGTIGPKKDRFFETGFYLLGLGIMFFGGFLTGLKWH